jgi:hypothetical protein
MIYLLLLAIIERQAAELVMLQKVIQEQDNQLDEVYCLLADKEDEELGDMETYLEALWAAMRE